MAKFDERITAVYADEDGNILDAAGLGGMGRTGRENVPLTPDDLIPLPETADLMLLPDHQAVGRTAEGEVLPIAGLAVAAILPAGYTRLYLPAYVRDEGAERLPLYGYTAVVVYHEPPRGAPRALLAHVALLHGAESVLSSLGVRHPRVTGMQRELLRLHFAAAGGVLPLAAVAHHLPPYAGRSGGDRRLSPVGGAGRYR